MRKILAILAIMFTTATLAQEKQSFTLDEAVTYALENNYQAVNAQRDILAAEQQRWETIAVGLPQVNGSLDYQNQLIQPTVLFPGGANGELVPATFGTPQTMTAGVQLNQLLFDGSYLVGLQASRVFLNISEQAKVKTDLEVRKAVINAYGNVLIADEILDILDSNLATVVKLYNDNKKIYENGLTELETVEQLELTKLNLENNLARSKEIRNIAYRVLKITMGMPYTNEITINSTLENLTQQNISLDLLDDDLSVQENIDYMIGANNVRAKELEVKLEQSRWLPSLGAFVNYGAQANSESFSFISRNQKWFDQSILGVSLNVPIFSSGQSGARVKRAKINLDKALTDLEETEQRLQLDLANARSLYEFNIKNYENAKRNLELSERIETKNRIKFTEGLSTSFDLAQSQQQLYTSQQQLLNAMLDVISSRVELETVLNKTPLTPSKN